MNENFADVLSKRVLVLDGAMGTMIQRLKLGEADFRGYRFKDHPTRLAGCNDLLCLTQPDKISDIHRRYLDAGADIIETNTFNSNGISLAGYGLSETADEINRAGAGIARATADGYMQETKRKVFVAGSMGPTGISLSINDSIDFDTLSDEYFRQASALIECGTDILLLETIFDTLNAKAALFGIEKAFEKTATRLPLVISATLTESGRLLSGQTVGAFLASISHTRPVCVGFNCSFGADRMTENVVALARKTPYRICVYPNAGLPDEMGLYTETPERMAAGIADMLEHQPVNIIGGCCGTTPEHIRKISETVRNTPPFVPEVDEDTLTISGLSPLSVSTESGFIKVGERCNVAGSRKFLRLINEGNTGEAIGIAAAQVSKGAGMLDINMDDGMLDASAEMTKFVRLLSADITTAPLPLMIDSSDFDVVRNTLRLIQGRPVVNSISLKNGEEEFVDKARELRMLGAVPAVMAFDEQGQAVSFERRIEICKRSYDILCGRCGFLGSEIIFDPNILAVATGIPEHDSYALDFLRTITWIKENLPGAKISGGVSNLSFAFRGIDPVRKAMHTVFLENAISRGMDMAIVNPATPLSSENMNPELRERVEDVILMRRDDASSRLLELAMKIKHELSEKTPAVKKPSVVAINGKASENLMDAVVNGSADISEELLRETVEEKGSAFSVVREVLMEGMNRVGVLFGRGDIFLPQVVRSAEAMKRAVEWLTPLLEKEAASGNGVGGGSDMPVMVLATVKGDVHDIGKNIVSIVMRCSGFDIKDLGVMVPAEKIVDAVREYNAAFVGLSGLITPSLNEMSEVVRNLEEAGIRIPVFIGGATTSDLHTAVRIAPFYSGPVIHTGDAASLPPVAAALTDPETAEAKRTEIAERLEKIRLEYSLEQQLLPLEKARSLARRVKTPSPVPSLFGRIDNHFMVDDVMENFNYRAFLSEWGLKPDSDESGDEASRLINDARAMLDRMKADGFRIHSRIFMTKASRDGDDIILDFSRGKPSESSPSSLRLNMLRSRVPNPTDGKTISLADYITENDSLALFAVTVAGNGSKGDFYSSLEPGSYDWMILESVSHRLVEAATALQHDLLRKKIWGIDDNSGIRPAIGYPCMPDQSVIFDFDKVLDYRNMGIRLTENGAMFPSATTTGLVLANPEARYFDLGKIGKDQFEDYARRRGLDKDYLRPFLAKNL